MSTKELSEAEEMKLWWAAYLALLSREAAGHPRAVNEANFAVEAYMQRWDLKRPTEDTPF